MDFERERKISPSSEAVELFGFHPPISTLARLLAPQPTSISTIDYCLVRNMSDRTDSKQYPADLDQFERLALADVTSQLEKWWF